MSNRQNVLQAVKYFGDPSRRQDYFHIYSSDVVLHGYQVIEPGLESVKNFYNAFWKVFPDAKLDIQELIEQDDVVVIRYVITGTQQREFMSIPPSEQTI